MAENKAHCDAVGGVAFRVPGDFEFFALSDALTVSVNDDFLV